MSNKLLIGFAVAVLAVAGSACSTADNANANANANANTAVASNTTNPGPDNSEITTATDATGVKTETRVFHNNPRVSRVVQKSLASWSGSGCDPGQFHEAAVVIVPVESFCTAPKTPFPVVMVPVV